MKHSSSSHSLGEIQYLQGLISDYDQKLKSNIWSDFFNFIQEEKFKCMHKQHKLKETEVEGMIMAKTFASASLFTS